MRAEPQVSLAGVLAVGSGARTTGGGSVCGSHVPVVRCAPGKVRKVTVCRFPPYRPRQTGRAPSRTHDDVASHAVGAQGALGFTFLPAPLPRPLGKKGYLRGCCLGGCAGPRGVRFPLRCRHADTRSGGRQRLSPTLGLLAPSRPLPDPPSAAGETGCQGPAGSGRVLTERRGRRGSDGEPSS